MLSSPLDPEEEEEEEEEEEGGGGTHPRLGAPRRRWGGCGIQGWGGRGWGAPCSELRGGTPSTPLFPPPPPIPPLAAAAGSHVVGFRGFLRVFWCWLWIF